MFCCRVAFILLVVEFTVCGSAVLKQLHNNDFGKSPMLLFGEKNKEKHFGHISYTYSGALNEELTLSCFYEDTGDSCL